jgi:hypothetical protein
MEPIATAAIFEIDGSDVHFAGYTFGDKWNGFDCPFFEKAAADSIVSTLELDVDATLVYDPAADAYIETCEEDSTSYEAQVIVTSNGPRKVYPIGAWAWTWSRAEG